MNITISKITPYYPRGNFVEWRVDEPDIVPAPPWNFIVERSESPNGPFERVTAEPLINALSWFDNLSLHHLHRYWYYRVYLADGDDCSYTSEAEALHTIEAQLPDHLQGEINKMRYDLDIKLSLDSGSRVKVLKRRNIGTPCTACTSSVLGISTKDHCLECFGTRFVGGFYAPIGVYADFDSPPVQEGLNTEGETELQVYRLLMLPTPLLVADDLIYEEDTGDLYEVSSVTVTRRRRVIIHQEPMVSLLARSHPFYDAINKITLGKLGTETFIYSPEFRIS